MYPTFCLMTAKFKLANHLTMTTSGQIMSWSDYLKTKENVWDFDCLHFAQYISISPHAIDCKQTWCKKIYLMDRVSWLKSLSLFEITNQCTKVTIIINNFGTINRFWTEQWATLKWNGLWISYWKHFHVLKNHT